MYNGIGLSTPRGSGTNGYVIRNLSFVKPPRQDNRDRNEDFKSLPKVKQANAAILDHDRKRKVEVKCMELSIKLEDEGLSEDVIEDKVQALRESLLADLEKMEPTDAKNFKEYEVHQRAAAKEKDNAKMRNALRINSEYVEGAAFDRELQEKLKEERKARREADLQARYQKEEKKDEINRGRAQRRSPSPRRRRSRSPRERRRRSPSPRRRSISPRRRSRSLRSRSSVKKSMSRDQSNSSGSRGRSPIVRRSRSPVARRGRSISSRSRSRDSISSRSRSRSSISSRSRSSISSRSRSRSYSD